MKTSSLIIDLIHYKIAIYNKMKNFLTINNIDTGNMIINFTGHLIEEIFDNFCSFANNNQTKTKFSNLSISNIKKFKINSIPKQFINLSTSSNQFLIPKSFDNKNINLNFFHNNALHTHNINEIHIKLQKVTTNSFNITPPIKSKRNSNFFGNHNSLPSPVMPSKVKLYKILKFVNKDTFLDVFENNITVDEQITDYELHVEYVNKKTSYYYLLIEFNEFLQNTKYKQYEISFIGPN